MPLPRRLAVFNKRVTNRIVVRFAGWAPGFAIVDHVGRSTGRRYETPVNLFRKGDGYVFALTYGVASWVQNVMAADGCTIRTRGRQVTLTDPRLYTDAERRDVPAPVRLILTLIDVDQFLALRSEG